MTDRNARYGRAVPDWWTGEPCRAPGQWSTDDVATYLNVHPSSVRAYQARQQMPPPDGRLGNQWWWWSSTITTWRPAAPRPVRTLGEPGER